MKKLVLLLLFASCSNDDTQTIDPCECDIVLDVTTFQFYTPDGIKFESVCVVENKCTGETQQKNKNTYDVKEIPILGTCFK
jgi:hypothetical protein